MSGGNPIPTQHALDRLRSLSMDDLRREWQLLYKVEAAKVSRDLLVLGLGYCLQEREHGGLGRALQRTLRTLAKTLRATGKVRPAPTLSLKPGARLVREWNGRAHTVTVVKDGYEHEGTIYPSLSTVAKKITGTHWSGPRFFGLPSKSFRPASDGAGRG